MTSSDPQRDDRELDAMLAAIARHDAPLTLATRVRLALDARESRLAWPRISFAAAVVAALVVAVALWTTSRRPTPAVPALASLPAPAPAPGGNASPSTTSPPAPEAADQIARPAPAVRVRPYRRASQDHDRALPALASLPDVAQRDISPEALQTAPLEIDRIEDIAPLTIQGGRDTSGRGDF